MVLRYYLQQRPAVEKPTTISFGPACEPDYLYLTKAKECLTPDSSCRERDAVDKYEDRVQLSMRKRVTGSGMKIPQVKRFEK